MGDFTYFRSGGGASASKHTLKVMNFIGLDLLNNLTNVSNQRGIHSLNYVWRNGMAQKRFGYDKIGYAPKVIYYPRDIDTGEVSDTAVENGNAINGIWEFVADDGEKHAIAHVGKLLFELKDGKGGYKEFSPIFTYSGAKSNCAYELEDFRSFAVPGQRRLWILGGNAFLMLHYERNGNHYDPVIEKVSNSDYAFVPTTSIAITCNQSKNSGRADLDYPNLLSPFRQNLLLTGTGKEDIGQTNQPFYEYELDAPINPANEREMYDMEIEISYSGKYE